MAEGACDACSLGCVVDADRLGVRVSLAAQDHPYGFTAKPRVAAECVAAPHAATALARAASLLRLRFACDLAF